MSFFLSKRNSLLFVRDFRFILLRTRIVLDSLILYLASLWSIVYYISFTFWKIWIVFIRWREVFKIFISRNFYQQTHCLALSQNVIGNIIDVICSSTYIVIWSAWSANTKFASLQISPNIILSNIRIFCLLTIRGRSCTYTKRSLCSQ